MSVIKQVIYEAAYEKEQNPARPFVGEPVVKANEAAAVLAFAMPVLF